MGMLDKMMRIAGRGEDGTAKAIKTNNDGNLLTQITGSNVESLQEQLLASYRKDPSGLGLLRVFFENTLSPDNDVVALGGTLANSLVRRPTVHRYIYPTANVEVKAKSDAQYLDKVIFDVPTRIVVTSIQIVTRLATPNIRVWLYFDGVPQEISLMAQAEYNTGVWAVQAAGSTVMTTCSHPLFKAEKINETVWQFTNRDGRPIECPNGLKITATNITETPYRYNAQIMYMTMP